MMRRGRTLVPNVHLPLRQVALCLDCDECFEIRPETPCPACGSATWTSLSRLLEKASSAQRPRCQEGSAHDDQPTRVRQLVMAANA